jgi:hypothetical protein
MSRRTRGFPLNAYNPADFAPDPRREAREAARAHPGSRGRDGLTQNGSLLGAPSNKTSDRKVRWPT